MDASNSFTIALSKLSASLAPHPTQIHQACILTLLRVIDNILFDPTRSNAKLRKIKVSNAAFWKRAGQWDGCIDFLLECGFTSSGKGEKRHLKFENESGVSREHLRRGRENIVKWAVEKLGLQMALLPACPGGLKTELEEPVGARDACINPVSENRLSPEETGMQQKIVEVEKSATEKIPCQVRPHSKEENLVSKQLLASKEIPNEKVASNENTSALTCAVQKAAAENVSTKGSATGSAEKKMPNVAVDESPSYSDHSMNATTSEEAERCIQSAEQMQKSADEISSTSDLADSQIAVFKEVSRDEKDSHPHIVAAAPKPETPATAPAEQCDMSAPPNSIESSKIDSFEPDKMADLLAEIENELNDDVNVNHAVISAQSAAVCTPKENVFNDTDKIAIEEQAADQCLGSVVADQVQNALSLEARILAEEQASDPNEDKATTAQYPEETENNDDQCSGLVEMEQVLVSLFSESDEEMTDQNSHNVKSNESNTPTPQCVSKNQVGVSGELANDFSTAEATAPLNEVTSTNSKQQSDQDTISEEPSQPEHTDAFGAYHSSFNDIPLPDGEFSSSDNEEVRAFRLGFELCHRLLISLWHTKNSLRKATRLSAQTRSITIGLSNVKPWTALTSTHICSENVMNSEPALIVPLSIVYVAWTYLLNTDSDAVTRCRTMYSWIVTNHPDFLTLSGIPRASFSTVISEADVAICNYVCNSLRHCGLVTIYGADIVAFSDDVSSDLSFFIGIDQGELNRCVKDGKSILIDERLVNKCHKELAKTVLLHVGSLLHKRELTTDESASFWYSCRYAIHHLLSCDKLDDAERLLLNKEFAEARLKSMGASWTTHSMCWECKRMVKSTARLTPELSSAHATTKGDNSKTNRSQTCVQSLVNMATILEDHANSISLDIITRGKKQELGTCFHLLGETIGSIGGGVTEEIKQYEQALAFRTEAFGDNQNHVSIADTLYALGCCYQKCRSYSLGQKYYEQSLKIYKKTLGYDHPSIARVLHNVGIMYIAQSDYVVAMKCLKKSLSIRMSSLGENDLSVADSLCWIGNIHREKKELNEARSCFTSAHQIKVAALGYNHPECSEILQNLGIVCYDLELYSPSLSYFKEAMLSRRANIHSPCDTQGLNALCESLNCIANVYRETGQFDRALQFSEQILKRRRAMAASQDKDQVMKLIHVYEDLVALTKRISRDESSGVIDKEKLSQVGTYLAEIGKLYDHKLRKPTKALLYYQEAMDAFKEINDYAQIISCLTAMGNIHVHTSANEKALSDFSKALVLTLRKDSGVPKQSACHADLLHNIGNCLSKKGDYKKSVVSYRDSLKMKTSLLTPGDLSVAKTEHCLALALLQLGQSDEALRLFQSSLKTRQSKLGADSLEVGFSLHNIGKIYFHKNKIDECIDCLERALEIKLNKMSGSASSLAESQHILASAFMKKDRYFDAIALLETALSSYHNMHDCELLSSDVMDLLGHAYNVTGDLARAKSSYEQSLDIKKICLGQDHISCANVLLEIGKLQVASNSLEEGLVTFKEVKRLHKIHYQKDNLKNAILLIEVGSIQYRRNKLDVALKCFMEALRIRRLLIEGESTEIAETLTHLGRVYQAKGDHTAAISCYQQSLDIKLDESKENEIKQLLGESYLKSKDYDAAVDCLEECLAFRERTNGNDSNEWLSTAFNLATAKINSSTRKDGALLLLDQCIFLSRQKEIIDERLANALFQYGEISKSNNDNEALRYFKESVAIRQQVGGRALDTADALYEIGLIHESRKQYSTTLHTYQESLKLRQSVDAQDERTADILYRIGEIYRLGGKLEMALNNLTVSLGAYYMSVGKNHPSVANCFHSIGYVHDAKGNTVDAMKNHKMALAVRRLNLGNNHFEVASSLDDIAALYQKLGDNTNALECLQEGLRIRRLQGSESIAIAKNLFSMGIIFAASNNNDRANDCYKKSLDISSRDGSDSKLEAQTLHQIGCLLAANTKYKEALQLWRTSLSKYREAGLSDDHMMVACTLGNIEMAENAMH